MFNNIIKFRKHELSSCYLHLNDDKYEDITLNLDKVVSIQYNPKYPSGYGEDLPVLLIKTDMETIKLYREDATTVNQLLENQDPKKVAVSLLKEYYKKSNPRPTFDNDLLCLWKITEEFFNNLGEKLDD